VAEKAELNLAVQYASSAGNLPTRAQCRRWVLAALESNAEITLRFVDAEEARTLNRDYRHKDYVPNVLTFEYGEIATALLGGDVLICPEIVEKEAAEQGKLLAHHYAHMAIHGVLHLQGYDHMDPADAEIMETREAVILKRFKIPNPHTA
jgi:probable rRNA maturation factor